MPPKAKARMVPSKAKAKAKSASKAPAAPRAGDKRKASGDAGSGFCAKRGKGAGGGVLKRDSAAPKGKVVDDYSVTLNQTNVGANNNKFYIIQVLEEGGQFYAWNRWGRVGDVGQNKFLACASKEKAIKEFESKFRSKTQNAWANRDSFSAKKGKYTLVETEIGGSGDSKAPMGKLTEAQVKKGEAVLNKLHTALTKSKMSDVTEYSSEFYTLIPHNFGWKKPVAITSFDMLQEKRELLKFFMRMGFEKIDSGKGLSPVDGVMTLALPKSLDESAKGICGKHDIKASNDQGTTLAKKQAGKPAKKMEASMYAAIMLYTSNAIYKDLNTALRDKNRAKISKYFKYLRLFLEAMGSMKQQKRTLWRGLSVDLSKDPQYNPGSEVTWWGVSSCTSEKHVAEGFAASCGSGCSIITINTKTACDISAISFFSNEKESLLRPGTKLKVKSRSTKNGITHITLDEVGCSLA